MNKKITLGLLLALSLSGCSGTNDSSSTQVSSSSTISSSNVENSSSLSEISSSSSSSETSSSISSSSSEDKVTTYKITFRTDSSQIIEPLYFEENATVSLDDLPILVDRTELSAPKFVCWTNDGIDVTSDFLMPNNDLELVAKWRAYNTWTIKYETSIPGYNIEDTVVTENNGLESYQFPNFSYPYKKLDGWYYDALLTNKVSDTLNESLFSNNELTLYASTTDTDVSATDTWEHTDNKYIGRNYTQIKNIDLSTNKTVKLTVNLPAYNKEAGAYGTTNIYFGGNDELITNGSIKSGYELFICGLDDTSAPVNGNSDPRAGSMALYKYNTVTGAREMVAACRRYVAPLLNSQYYSDYAAYMESGTNELSFDLELIIGDTESYIKVNETTVFTFNYNPDGNGFGLYTNPTYSKFTYFTDLVSENSETTLVKFNTDGANETLEDLEVSYGSKLGTLPTVTKDGSVFNGWTLDNNPVSELYVPGQVETITLKATWGDAPRQYNVWDGTKAASIALGSGTETDPYVITSGGELLFLASMINVDKDAAYASAYYELGADLDLNNQTTYVPIGLSDFPFKGHFDGNGYLIKGLTMNRAGATGLFGNIADAYLYDIDVEANITSTGVNSAILVGRSQISTIENCVTRGTITSNTTYTGGITATINAYASGVTGTQTKMIIKNCTNYATVTSTVTGNTFIGGILAQYAETAPTEVVGCTNRGNVTGGGSFIGGIIGLARKNESSIIKDCYNFGNITSDAKQRNTGGIAGASRARIENCYGWENAKVNNIAGNNATAQLYPTAHGGTVPGAIICGQWDIAGACTSNSGFFNCGMCDADGNPVEKV